jgi:hypothetical protein
MSVSIYLSFIYTHFWARELGAEPRENHGRTKRTGSVLVLWRFCREFCFNSSVFAWFSRNAPFRASALSATTVHSEDLRHGR